MRIAPSFVVVFLLLFAGPALAATFQIPEKHPVISVEIPGAWKPETTDKGVACESPDQAATVFLEIAKSEKGVTNLIEESIDWLVTDQHVKIKKDTEEKKDFVVDGVNWSRIAWDADSAEWGPSQVGFLMAMVDDKRMLITTFWITKAGMDKNMPTLEKILNSIKAVAK